MVKIQTGIVKYLNTKPLLYGIENSPVSEKIELIPGYPAEIAKMLEKGSIDLGLVPVAAIPNLNNPNIISDFCIGCDGAVASVCIFSEVPMEEINEVYMDYQSRTSVQLAKILLRNYWKTNAAFKDATPDFRDSIKGNTAGLVIGDRAFEQRQKSAFIYDLGEAWKAYTGLPFVFAAWVSNKEQDPAFVQQFNAANRWGVQHIEEVVRQYPSALFDLHHYYHDCISYALDEEKKRGMQLFLEMITAQANKCKM